MKRILLKHWFWYVVENYGKTIYTYAVCESEEKANETLDFIIENYES